MAQHQQHNIDWWAQYQHVRAHFCHIHRPHLAHAACSHLARAARSHLLFMCWSHAMASASDKSVYGVSSQCVMHAIGESEGLRSVWLRGLLYAGVVY